MGCPGLDDFEDWPYRNMGSPIYASYAMQCGRQTYKNLADIVDKFASDQQYWSVKFLEAKWQWNFYDCKVRPIICIKLKAHQLAATFKANESSSGDSIDQCFGPFPVMSPPASP